MTGLSQMRYASAQVSYQLLPDEGPRTVPISLDFTVDTDYSLDLRAQIQQTRISVIQSIYVDNSQNDNALTVVMVGTAHRIIAKGRTQGFYPVLALPEFQCTFHCAGGGDAPTVIYLCNMPVSPGQWNTI